jgi:endonuclease YncB( thermonuclease family)
MVFDYFKLEKETDSGPLFSFNGKTIYAKCVSVYDGDTVTVKFLYRGECLKYKVRLMGIDTPELRTKNAQEKELSQKIREHVAIMILNKIIKLKCYDFDKYGRILADIYVSDICVNEYLLSRKFAVRYDGDTKTDFSLSNFENPDTYIPPVTKSYSFLAYYLKK